MRLSGRGEDLTRRAVPHGQATSISTWGFVRSAPPRREFLLAILLSSQVPYFVLW